jgi:hypothetical protein
VIPWLTALSTRKKTGPGAITRVADSNTSRESVNRNRFDPGIGLDRAALPWQLPEAG